MERSGRAQFNTQIYEEACEWFIECRAGDLDAAARVEFDRWLRKSPEHQGAYLEIAAIWNEGPVLDSANRWDLDTLIAQASEDPDNVVVLGRSARPVSPGPQAAPFARTPGNIETINPAPASGSVPATHRRRRVFAVAASILLAAVSIGVYMHASSDVYTTAVGEQRSITLADGTTVELNSLSRIRVRYSKYERNIDLVDGQALFRVARDTARPFVVRSGETRVRAVGTQFDVYRKTSGITVTVVEGRVAILEDGGKRAASSREGGSGPDTSLTTPLPAVSAGGPPTFAGSILLAAGEQVTVTSQTARKNPHPNVAGATAWTQHQLVFDAASLSDVAEEFNRYNKRKLVIDPSALGSTHISGVFLSTDPAPLIRFLRDRPGLRVTETSTQIRIEKTV